MKTKNKIKQYIDDTNRDIIMFEFLNQPTGAKIIRDIQQETLIYLSVELMTEGINEFDAVDWINKEVKKNYIINLFL